jgi:hypothetical protein
LPLFLYAGGYLDSGFVAGTSVEGFALGNLASLIVFRGQEFRVVWSPGLMIVYPPVSAEEEEALRIATKHFGLLELDIYYPASEEEFERYLPDLGAANSWYSTLHGFQM